MEGQGYLDIFFLGELLNFIPFHCLFPGFCPFLIIVVRCFCGSRLQPIVSLFFFKCEECFYCASCLAKLNIQCIVMSFYGVCMPRSFYSIEIEAWMNGIKDILTNDLASSEPWSHVLEWLLLRTSFSNVNWLDLQKQMCWKRDLYVDTAPVITTGSRALRCWES